MNFLYISKFSNRIRLLALICFVFSFSGSALANSKNYVQLKFDSLFSKTENICFEQGTKAKKLIQELYHIANTNSTNRLFLYKCFFIESTTDYVHGKNDTALLFRIDSTLTFAKNSHAPINEINLLSYSLAISHSCSGDYTKSLTLALQTFEQLKNQNDSILLVKTLNLLGNICFHVELYSMSSSYYEQAINYTSLQHRTDYYKARINLFNAWRYCEPTAKQSIDSMTSLIQQLDPVNDIGLLLPINMNMAAYYLSNKHFDKAYKHLDFILQKEFFIDNSSFISTLYQNLAVYFFLKEKNYTIACNYTNKAKQIAKENGDTWRYLANIRNLSFIYETLGNIDSAFFYLKETEELSKQVSKNPQIIEAYKQYVSVYLEASENKLTIAEQELALKNKRFLVVIISSISIILVILSFLRIIQQKKRIREKENKDLEKRLKQENVILQLQEEKNKLQEEMIESKLREITSYSLQLANKNILLQQISDLAKALPNDKKELIEIKHLIRNNLNTTNDWNDFLGHFNNVHPKFFEKLKDICNNLTEVNLRMCAYFRIGMPSKQIAQILNINSASITVHRYRLKKKLGLGEDDNLYDFLRSL